MTKKETSVQEKRAEEAIRSLYQQFPEAGKRYSNFSTDETAKLDKQIRQRHEILSRDKTLVAIQRKLADAKRVGRTKANDLHGRVDSLMRRFRLRGVTDSLIADIEKLAKEKTPLIEDRDD